MHTLRHMYRVIAKTATISATDKPTTRVCPSEESVILSSHPSPPCAGEGSSSHVWLVYTTLDSQERYEIRSQLLAPQSPHVGVCVGNRFNPLLHQALGHDTFASTD